MALSLNRLKAIYIKGFRRAWDSFGLAWKHCFYEIGGEGGIRTLDRLLTYTHFPGVRFQPLSHFTVRRSLAQNHRRVIGLP